MIAKKRPSGCIKKLLPAAGSVFSALIILLTALVINQNIALARETVKFPAPGRLLEVEGHLMHINCKGGGSPTVVIDAGNGSFSVEWTPIQDQLSRTIRICTYDRSGYGWSEPGLGPRDGVQIVSELHQLLHAAGESGPFVLVGHSLGGVHVRLYAARYPDQTAGLVLIDTANPLEVSPEFQIQMQSSIGFYQVMNLLTRSGWLRVLGPLSGKNSLPVTALKLPPELQELYLNLLLDPNQYAAAISEMEQIPQTFRQAGRIQSGYQPFGALPLIVLTAGQTSAPGSTPFDERLFPASNRQIDFQSDLSRLSSRGEHRVITRSGHSVHLDAPEEVIRAIRELVETIRD